jgi:large subunit ribosomal protein L4
MELAVYKISGEKTSKKVKLNNEIFGVEPNDHAIWLDVKQHLANARQGTHKSKERGEITGSTRKIKRQKGTGTARMGSIKSGILRGGGRIFGPQPRDYGFKLNKKVKRLAKLSALSYKVKENGITVVEEFTFDTPKTKEYVSMLSNLGLQEKKTLVVLENADQNLLLSARNLKRTKVARADSLNTYDILNANNLVISENSMKVIEQVLGSDKKEQ